LSNTFILKQLRLLKYNLSFYLSLFLLFIFPLQNCYQYFWKHCQPLFQKPVTLDSTLVRSTIALKNIQALYLDIEHSSSKY